MKKFEVFAQAKVSTIVVSDSEEEAKKVAIYKPDWDWEINYVDGNSFEVEELDC